LTAWQNCSFYKTGFNKKVSKLYSY